MKKHHFILPFVILSLFHQLCFAQTKRIDSLKLVSSRSKEDSSKINTLNYLAQEFSLTKPDTAIIISNEALQLAQNINWKKGIAQSENALGNFYAAKQNYKISYIHYNQAMSVWEELIASPDKVVSLQGKAGKISTISDIGNTYNNQGEFAKAIEYWLMALKIGEETKNNVDIFKLLNSIADNYRGHGEYKKAMDYYLKIIERFKGPEDKSKLAKGLQGIALVYSGQGDYQKALENLFKSLSISEEIGDKYAIAQMMGTIGSTYGNLEVLDKALIYFLKGLKMTKELGLKKPEARNYLNIGLFYTIQGEYNKGLNNLYMALKLAEEQDMKDVKAIAYDYIGFSFTKQKNYPKALDYTDKALKINEELDNKHAMVENIRNIGDIYIKIGKYNEAEKMLYKALDLAKLIGAKYLITGCEKVLSELYEKMGKPLLALDHYKKYITVRDSLNNEETQKNQVRTEMNYEFDKKELAAKADQEKKDVLILKEKQKQKLILYFVIVGLMIVVIFSFFLYRRFKLTERQKEIIEQQKHLVEENQKEILDSITYAKRIQEAILPPIDLIKKHLPNSFVFYKPKAIVAGDFYWMEAIDAHVFIAAADCTGHGVPGALVSVVCSNALNRTVKEFNLTDPGKILDKTRELVLETFEKSNSEVKDGMDISLLCIDTKNKKISWSGANNPLWYIQDDVFKEIKATKQPIGKTDKPTLFTTHQIEHKENTTFYLFTDGFADQFGGPNEKKFKYKQFSQLLLQNNQSSQTK